MFVRIVMVVENVYVKIAMELAPKIAKNVLSKLKFQRMPFLT